MSLGTNLGRAILKTPGAWGQAVSAGPFWRRCLAGRLLPGAQSKAEGSICRPATLETSVPPVPGWSGHAPGVLGAGVSTETTEPRLPDLLLSARRKGVGDV